MEEDSDHLSQASSSLEYDTIFCSTDQHEFETFFNNVDQKYKYVQTHQIEN